jgi:hypothetical protein
MPFGLDFAADSSPSSRGRALVWLIALCCGVSVYATQSQSPAEPIDRVALLNDLRALSADDMEGRLIGSTGGIKARDYIVERFKSVGLEPFSGTFVQPFAMARGANVVGSVRGSRRADLNIVISAHYDHLGIRGGKIYNGADDNASGTAALIALAAFFARHAPEHSMIFAAFDGEEEGLLGSHAFIEHPPVDLASIVVNVNLDMVGRDAKANLFAVGTYLNPFLRPYVERVARSAPVHLLIGHDDPNDKRAEDWTKDSDHWAFQQAKIPAIYLGDEDFAQHHQPTDDYETMTYGFFEGAAATALSLVQEFDRNLEAINRARSAR